MCEQIKCTDEVYLSGILHKFHQSLSLLVFRMLKITSSVQGCLVKFLIRLQLHRSSSLEPDYRCSLLLLFFFQLFPELLTP